MGYFELSKEAPIVRVGNAASAATGNYQTGVVDCAGADAVNFVANLGASVTNGSVISMTIFENTVSGSSAYTGATAVTGGSATLTAANGSGNNTLEVDVIRPANRFLWCQLNITAQTAAVDSVNARIYRMGNIPQTAASGTTSTLSTPEH